jgi:hypothetical protein
VLSGDSFVTPGKRKLSPDDRKISPDNNFLFSGDIFVVPLASIPRLMYYLEKPRKTRKTGKNQ